MGTYQWKPFTLLVSAEEVKGNEMKIEAGKYYQTRDGRKVGPIKSYDDRAFYKASFCCGKWTYLENGKWAGDTKEDNRDLISEWQDEAPSPIRTVTRREVVEWKDDVLHIIPHEKDCVLVGFRHPEDQTFKSLTSEQLREAAHLLNQIAEVLQENGE